MIIFILVFVGTAAYLGLGDPIKKMVYPITYQQYVQQYAQMYGLDEYMVYAVIKAESNFDKTAISRANAKGLMQLTDSTALWCAKQMQMTDFNLAYMFDPDQNINMGCWYLRHLLDYYGGNEIHMAAAYNGGLTNVDQWIADNNGTQLSISDIPFKETRDYTSKILKFHLEYKKIYGGQ